MPVKFRCSECTQKLSIDDKFIGKLVACVRCGAKQRVPLETSPEFAQPKPAAPPEPSPPETPERKAPRAFKPWQPRPVRSTPLPSETPAPESFREEKPPDEPAQPRRREFEPSLQDRAPDVESPVFEENQSPQSLDRPPEPADELWPGEHRDLPEAGDFAPEPAVEFGSIPEPELLDPDSPDLGSFDPDWKDPRPAAPVSEPALWMPPPEVTEVTEPQNPPISVAPPEPEMEHAYAAPHAESSLVPPAKKLDVEELIDMTAMVDIVFFLLIFFLVTSMHTLDSTIPMPAPDPQKGAAKEPTTIAAIDADDSYIVVRIDKNDKITIEGAEVRSERDLLFKLRDLRLGASRPEKLMVIGHGEATHGTAVMILDAGRELGMEHVKLSVQDEEE